MKVDQALYGYKGGHRRLASSYPFQTGDERFLVRMTDLSGARVMSGFEEYLSGYALSSGSAYVLAKTWYAPECERPGCVWTHAIFITSDLWNELSPDQVCSMFRRPDPDYLNLEEYSRPLTMSRSSVGCPPLLTPLRYTGIVAALYADSLPVLISGDEMGIPLDLLLMKLVWQRPLSMRQTLSFCTGALSFLGTEQGPLRIQVMPARILRTVRDDVHRLPSEEMPDKLSGWADVLANDLFVEDRFLRQLFEPYQGDSPRYSEHETVEIIRLLASARVLLRDFDAQHLDVRSLLQSAATMLPAPAEQSHLKEEILRRITSVPSGSLELLRFLLDDSDRATAFTCARKPIVIAAEQVAEIDPFSTLELLNKHLFQPADGTLTQEIIHALLRGLDIGKLGKGRHIDSQILFAMAQQQPDVTSDPGFWLLQQSLEESAELADLLAESIGEKYVLRSLLSAGRFDLLIRMLRMRGAPGAFEAFRLAESLRLDSQDDYRKLLALRGEISDFTQSVVLEIQRNRHRCNGAQLFLLSSANVEPSTLASLVPASDIWIDTLVSLTFKLERIHAVAFYIACGDEFADGWKFFSRSFDLLHEALANKNLRSEWWWLLKSRLPSLAIWEKWDKCERLRRALVHVILRKGLSPETMREFTRQDWLFDRLVEIYRNRI
jgi:hypothetical protein